MAQIVCGKRAGAVTILLDEGSRFKADDLQGEMAPDFTVSRLSAVRDILEEHFDLQPPLRRQESPPPEALEL